MSKKKQPAKRAPGAGRPVELTEEVQFCIAPGGSKFHKGSVKRAILDAIVDRGGCMSLGDILEHFHHDVRPQVMALRRGGWLTESEG